MSYRYYHYNSSYRYHSTYEHIECIFYDLKKIFFSLDDETLACVLDDYKNIYGNDAYRYANETMYKWKHHLVGMSNQTLSRLVNLVPPYLPSEIRIKLFQKLIRHQNISFEFISENISERTSWDNVQYTISNVRRKMDSICSPENLSKQIKKLSIPDNLKHSAHWLMDDDITAAKAVMDHYILEDLKLKISSCYKDLDLYEQTTKKVSDVYQTSYFHSSCPIFTISINVKAEERTFWQKMALLFKK